MRKLFLLLPAAFCAAALLSQAAAQPQGEKPTREPGKDKPKDQAKDYSDAPIVIKMMAFNKKKDGKLTKDEVTDTRLQRLFDQADTNKDGIVTKEELMALAAKLDEGGERGGPGGERGPGDRGPGDRGPGPGGDRGPGDRGPGGPPQPGQILAPRLQEMLKLTDKQKTQLEDLQKEVDSKLGKILTDDQKKQLKEMRDRGPGGPGRPGERGPGGPPPERE